MSPKNTELIAKVCSIESKVDLLHEGILLNETDKTPCHFWHEALSCLCSISMKIIPLTQGKVTIVDDEDYEMLSQWKWYAHTDGNEWYAVRNSRISKTGRQKTIRMQREILKVRKGKVVDHIDHDGLNNQRYNIRICTQAENTRNRRSRKLKSSKYKGVHWNKLLKKWQGQIAFDGIRQYLGLFDSEDEAARSYNREAKMMHGEFAELNDVPSSDNV